MPNPEERLTDLPAGVQLDALVAVNVMGWQRLRPPSTLTREEWERGVRDTGPLGPPCAFFSDEQGVFPNPSLPSYSTDISAAWEVVEKMRTRVAPSFKLFLETLVAASRAQQYECTILAFGTEWPQKVWSAYAETASHAICLAALQAVESQ